MTPLNNIVSVAALFFNIQNTSDLSKITLSENLSQYYFKNDSSMYDSIMTITENSSANYFYKCCPDKYIYEPRDRKCVQAYQMLSIYEELGVDVNFFKYSLSECAVIVDREIESFEVFISNYSALKINDEVFKYGNYCVDKIYESQNYIARVCYDRSYCTDGIYNGEQKWCLKKCCRDGYALLDRKCKIDTSFGIDVEENSDIFEETDGFALLKDDGQCIRYMAPKSEYSYRITGSGSFLIEENNFWKEYKVNELKYCVETKYDTSGNKTGIVLLCTRNDQDDTRFLLSKIAMILSCICLLITILVYVFVNKLRRIIEKIIVCYCVCQTVAFLLLTTMHFYPKLGEYCKPLGFSFNFAFIGCFSWLNVMSYDIWRTLGSMKAKAEETKFSILKKMALYSAYAWIIPTVVTITFYMANEKIYSVSDVIFPYIGDTECLLENRLYENNYGHTVYFVLPVGLLISINMVFFVKTIRYLIKVNRALHKINDCTLESRMKTDRNRVLIMVKLTLLMGVNWTFEVLSSIINFKVNSVLQTVEIFLDTLNYLQGVFIFLILVVKWRKIKAGLTRKLNGNITQSTLSVSSNL